MWRFENCVDHCVEELFACSLRSAAAAKLSTPAGSLVQCCGDLSLSICQVFCCSVRSLGKRLGIVAVTGFTAVCLASLVQQFAIGYF